MQETCEKRGRPFLKAYNKEQNMLIVFRPRCKTWGCPPCAKINTKLWAARAHRGAFEFHEVGKSLRFLTLTSHESLDKITSLKVWPLAWKKLHTRANREGGHGAYLMVPERHKDGRLHMHALVTWPMGKKWWKDNGRECGLGFMSDSDIIRHPGGAASYVTKYLMKSLTDDTWPPKWRRARPSRDWPKLENPDKPDGWRFYPMSKDEPLDDMVIRHAGEGTKVFILDHMLAWEAIGAIDNQGVFVN